VIRVVTAITMAASFAERRLWRTVDLAARSQMASFCRPCRHAEPSIGADWHQPRAV